MSNAKCAKYLNKLSNTSVDSDKFKIYLTKLNYWYNQIGSGKDLCKKISQQEEVCSKMRDTSKADKYNIQKVNKCLANRNRDIIRYINNNKIKYEKTEKINDPNLVGNISDEAYDFLIKFIITKLREDTNIKNALNYIHNKINENNNNVKTEIYNKNNNSNVANDPEDFSKIINLGNTYDESYMSDLSIYEDNYLEEGIKLIQELIKKNLSDDDILQEVKKSNLIKQKYYDTTKCVNV